MALGLRLPTVNQLITLAIALVIIMFALKLMPESVKNLFRV